MISIKEIYEKSLGQLYLYLKVTKTLPNEKEWNKYALMRQCLSSKSLEFLYGYKFSVMCRKLIKEVNKEKGQ